MASALFEPVLPLWRAVSCGRVVEYKLLEIDKRRYCEMLELTHSWVPTRAVSSVV